jgi:beta-lactamase class D/D-alanyl-D-alanine dipeptidase
MKKHLVSSLLVLLFTVSFLFAQSAPPPEKNKREADLVELVKLDKTIKLDIRYARSDNFVGRPVYSEARAFLQRPAAESLLKVHKELKKQGLGLVIFDGYRPWSVTKLFWEVTPEDKRKFVANPKNGSRHNRGAAVDLSIYDLKTGKLLPMPSDFDDFSDKAHPEYKGGTAEETRNRDLLRKLMEAAGFTVNSDEWWHFDYKDWREYGLYDIAFSSIKHEAKPNPKVKENKNLKKFFESADVSGGIVIYDLQKNLYTVFDKKRMNTGFVPASTSKIIHSLIFLDSGAVKDDSEVIKWDGTKRWVDAWNQDHNLRSAFKVSAAWFYHEASKRMKRETIQKYYDLSNYGNRDTSGFGEIYWVKGDLRITPKEQVEFLVRLYENRLPFSPQVIANVKDMIIEEKTEKFTLRAKTGWSDAYTPQVGWWVGYVEKTDNVYFFAIEIDINKDEDAAKRKEITRSVLKYLKVIE